MHSRNCPESDASHSDSGIRFIARRATSSLTTWVIPTSGGLSVSPRTA